VVQAPPPVVQVVQRAPLVVHGAGFHRGETVRVRLRAGTIQIVRLTVASGRGTFSVRFTTGIDRCSAAAIVAVGKSGDGAQAKALPAKLCPPA
jgi:hypothetical protein